LRRLVFLLALATPAFARVMPLERLPDDKLAGLAALLQHGDVALIESNRDGTLKQVTLILFVAALPETVHEVLIHPGEYKKFVPNVSKSTWEPRPEGGSSTWKLDLPIACTRRRGRSRSCWGGPARGRRSCRAWRRRRSAGAGRARWSSTPTSRFRG